MLTVGLANVYLHACKLEEYERRCQPFYEIARNLFDRLRADIPSQCVLHEGSFSVKARSIAQTAAKIVIYAPDAGKPHGALRYYRDGFYICVRAHADGPIGGRIWEGSLFDEMPQMAERLRADPEPLQITYCNREQFRFFPLMAGDDLGKVAELLLACGGI